MGQMNIVEKLLKGSAEIDRMRSEIDQIVNILIGYLNKVNAQLFGDMSNPRQGHCFTEGGSTWIVGRSTNYTGRIFIELEISPWSGVRTVYSSEWKERGLKAETDHVRGIHHELPRLVMELEKQFPDLTRAWSSLVRGAE